MGSAAPLPQVSVIIAAYNVEKYIERALRSVDEQGVPTEIIVVDDASTDGSAALIARYGGSNIRLIRRPHNRGPAAARNDAIAAATAPWIAILDGDDAFMPQRLQRCLQRAETTNADIVIDNLVVCREADGTQQVMYEGQDFESAEFLSLAAFITGNSAFLGGKSFGYVKPIFSRAFLQKNNLRYDADIRIGEDYMLLAEALACGARCVIEASAGYLYTARAGSTSHRLTEDDVNRMLAGDKKFLSRYTLDTTTQKAQQKRTANLLEALAFTRLVDNLKRKDFFAALQALIAHPAAALNLYRPIHARVKKLLP